MRPNIVLVLADGLLEYAPLEHLRIDGMLPSTRRHACLRCFDTGLPPNLAQDGAPGIASRIRRYGYRTLGFGSQWVGENETQSQNLPTAESLAGTGPVLVVVDLPSTAHLDEVLSVLDAWDPGAVLVIVPCQSVDTLAPLASVVPVWYRGPGGIGLERRANLALLSSSIAALAGGRRQILDHSHVLYTVHPSAPSGTAVWTGNRWGVYWSRGANRADELYDVSQQPPERIGDDPQISVLVRENPSWCPV